MMSDALVEENASEKEFESLYSDLNAARAAFFDPNADQSDEAGDARCDRYFMAERTFMATPAPRPCWVWMKWEVLEIAVTRDITDGRHNDNRIVIMISSIKADHLRFERDRMDQRMRHVEA
jgi:hypothetical protein